MIRAVALAPLLFAAPALAQEAPAEEEPAAASGPTTYALDAGASYLAVLVKYDRNALVGGHDHVVAPNTFTGTVTWDAADPSACKIDISFPVTALQVDPSGSRKRAGLEGSTSDGDKKKIKENLEGKHQLEGSRFPKISFTSTRCKANGDRFSVTGPLNLHGVGHDVTANMKITADGKNFAASGSFSATHSDWGMDPFSALLGSLRNDNALSFTVDVKGAAK